MIARLKTEVRRWWTIVLTRELSLPEALAVGAALLLVGTIYCQIYCFLALQEMGGATMHLSWSIHRASVDVVFAFAAFELSKRVAMRGRAWQWLLVMAIFAVMIAAAVAWRMQLPVMSMGLTPRRMAVDRIPFMLVAALGLFYFHWRRNRPADRPMWSRASSDPEGFPPSRSIDWVKAAGNYVEVRAGGRTQLMRMTMRQAASLLPDEAFVQIHRSVIVSRDRISRVKGRRSVEMADGMTFSVGDAYRSNLT